MLIISLGSGPRKVWAIARQHPGETMAEWFMEGYIERLLDESDPVARAIRRDATFYCVPNMNPGECVNLLSMWIYDCMFERYLHDQMSDASSCNSLFAIFFAIVCRWLVPRAPAHERGGGEPEQGVGHHRRLHRAHPRALPRGLPR